MYNYMHNEPVSYTWNEEKRLRTLAERGLDFADAPAVFEGPIFTQEDDRLDYGEDRWVSMGMLGIKVVVIVYTERKSEVRIISMREATRYERELYFRNFRGS